MVGWLVSWWWSRQGQGRESTYDEECPGQLVVRLLEVVDEDDEDDDSDNGAEEGDGANGVEGNWRVV